MTNTFQQWIAQTALNGANQSYIEDLYEEYLKNPESVEPSWRQIFDSLPKNTALSLPEQAHSPVRDYFKRLAREQAQTNVGMVNSKARERLVKVLQWVNGHRNRGHLDANLDPLNLWERMPSPTLDYKFYGFTDADLDQEFDIGGYVYNRDKITLRELAANLKQTYCGTLGFEFMHVNDLEARTWLQSKAEYL